MTEQPADADPAAAVRRPAGAPTVRERPRAVLRETVEPARCGRIAVYPVTGWWKERITSAGTTAEPATA